MQCSNADAVVTIAITFGFFLGGCHYFFLRRGRTSGRVFYNSKILSNGYNNRLCKEKNWIHIYTIKGYNLCTYIIMSILITMVSCYISRCHSSDVR